MVNIRISGVWTSLKRQREDGTEYLDHSPMQFHILSKDKWRDMFSKDPDHTGSALELLNEMEFPTALAIREGDEKAILNEDFFNAMIDDYLTHFEEYKPGFKEKLVKDKAFAFIRALTFNDSAYYERFCGIVCYIVQNKEKFKDIKADHYNELESIYNWWKAVDNRERTVPYFDWAFKYVLKKYKSNMFYKRSVNHVLEFIYINSHNWHFHESYYPQKWFGNGRGRQVTELWGGNF